MDTLSNAARSERMSRIRGKDTKPELVVRQLLHALGYRYRLRGALPGRPDLVFPGRKRVVFVHGCFWHRHSSPTCKLARLPKSKLDFWLPKLQRNRERDNRTFAQLTDRGWHVHVVWECELMDKTRVIRDLQQFLGPPGRAK